MSKKNGAAKQYVVVATAVPKMVVVDVSQATSMIADGLSIPEVAKALRISKEVLMRKLTCTPEVRALYESATVARAQIWVEQIMDIADEDCTIPILDQNGEIVGRRVDTGRIRDKEVRISARQWAARHMLPKYMEKNVGKDMVDALSNLLEGLGKANNKASALPIVDVVENDAPNQVPHPSTNQSNNQPAQQPTNHVADKANDSTALIPTPAALASQTPGKPLNGSEP